MHFGNFVTATGAKSIIFSNCVFNLSLMDSLGYSKLIFEPNFGPNWSQTVVLEDQKPAKKT